MKAFTDISQSKKLAEILPPESADMEYMFLKKDNSKVSNVPFVKEDDEPEWPDDGSYDFIPCWSLAALYSILPTFTLDSSDDKYFRIHCCKKFSEWYNNPVDACYELILKLHELKML